MDAWASPWADNDGDGTTTISASLPHLSNPKTPRLEEDELDHSPSKGSGEGNTAPVITGTGKPPPLARSTSNPWDDDGFTNEWSTTTIPTSKLGAQQALVVDEPQWGIPAPSPIILPSFSEDKIDIAKLPLEDDDLGLEAGASALGERDVEAMKLEYLTRGVDIGTDTVPNRRLSLEDLGSGWEGSMADIDSRAGEKKGLNSGTSEETVPIVKSQDPHGLEEVRHVRDDISSPPTKVTMEADHPVLELNADVHPTANTQLELQEKEEDIKNGPTDADDEFGDFGDFADHEPLEDLDKGTSVRDSFTSTSATLTIPTYDIDPSLVYKLYPTTSNKTYLPQVDEVISAISARKAWYRISREGTMGKHNSGDNDDYVRVTWAKSKISKQVNEIVAKWVSEGRFGTAGSIAGSQNYGAIFGWGEGSDATGLKANASRFSAPLGIAGWDQKKTHTKSSFSVSGQSTFPSPIPPPSPAVDFGWGSTQSPTIKSIPGLPHTSLGGFPKPVMSSLSDKSSQIASPVSGFSRELVQGSSVSEEPPTLPALPTQTKPQAFLPLAKKPEAEKTITIPLTDSAPTSVDAFDEWGVFETVNTKDKPPFEKSLEKHSVKATVPIGGGMTNDTWGLLDSFEQRSSSGGPIEGLGMNTNSTRTNQTDLVFNMDNTNNNSKNNHNEDDWGEMINSPAVSTVVSPHQSRPSTSAGHKNTSSTTSVTSHRETGIPRSISASLNTPGNLNTQPNIEDEPASNAATSADNWDLSIFEKPETKVHTVNSPTASLGALSLGVVEKETNDGRIVREIVAGLPDLSYMLK